MSGGNMANFVASSRRAAKAHGNRVRGLAGGQAAPACYVSKETHTWIQKAADLFGLGTESVRWIPTDADQRMDVAALEKQIVQIARAEIILSW